MFRLQVLFKFEACNFELHSVTCYKTFISHYLRTLPVQPSEQKVIHNKFTTNIFFVTEFSEKHLGKTPLSLQMLEKYPDTCKMWLLRFKPLTCLTKCL